MSSPVDHERAEMTGQDVLGRINPGGSPSLLLNGHVDVVPAEAALWSSDPLVPVRSDGWLAGRGAVELASIVTGAKALARFIAEFFARGAGFFARGAGTGMADAGPGAAG
ncbi:MAG TPA: M20/M25/M40 family metallo-hydrolase [Streptosporangiaceae bacterium]|nr:M20/M25/M40 family metallo-hydrolase [Streptosporangiaceae bacterium]